MTSSLVGSEMCIRDRVMTVDASRTAPMVHVWKHPRTVDAPSIDQHPVSYTHLTLPTICSV
eukprot:3269854-Prorocentrum_lima.AAC.1